MQDFELLTVVIERWPFHRDYGDSDIRPADRMLDPDIRFVLGCDVLNKNFAVL